MAKKTRTSKKKSTRKTVGTKGSRAAAKKAGRTASRAKAGTKAATKAVSKRPPAGGTARTRPAKPEGNKAAASRKAARTGTGSSDAASNVSRTKASVAPKAATAPAVYSASVIRIKTNAKTKRTGRARVGANSVNHRAKSGATPATAQDPIQFREESRRPPKTQLSAKELREFKLLLLAKRAELCGDVERLTAEAFHQVEEGGNDRSAMPIHMADLGSDNWEQDFTLGLIDTERSLVHEIDEALKRIDNKTYGVCLATHNRISLARLRAKPWAKYCIEYARAREEGRAF
jgi:DnaK suppressor protein